MAGAQDFDAVLGAAPAGDFATVLDEQRPLAEQGRHVSRRPMHRLRLAAYKVGRPPEGPLIRHSLTHG